eukprot:1633286-Pleurochrysis_carterae.AAC.3
MFLPRPYSVQVSGARACVSLEARNSLHYAVAPEPIAPHYCRADERRAQDDLVPRHLCVPVAI